MKRRRQSSSGLRAAVVGAGLMGRFHAAAVPRAGGKLAAVVDPDAARGRVVAGAANVFSSLEELSAGERLDVVHVCTPVETHVSLVEQALALGAHAIVEKPVASDAASTASLVSAAAELRLMLVPVHQFPFQPGVLRLLARRQELGTLVRCAFETATAGAEQTGRNPNELVHEILPHPLALFWRLTPVPLEELAWTVVRPAPGELRAIAAAAGTSFEIVVSTRGRPTRAQLELIGTRASARADLYHGFCVLERGAPTRLRKATRPFTVAGSTAGRAFVNLAARAARGETAYPGLRELVQRTYEAIANGSAPPIEAEETLSVARVRDAIIGAGRG